MNNDLISRQALMKEFADFVKRSNNSDFARVPTWNDAVSLVDSMPLIQPEQKWIPVSEKLPNFAQRVLVSTVNYVYEAIYFDEDAGWSTYNVTFKDVEESEILAWMPLPATYRGKN